MKFSAVRNWHESGYRFKRKRPEVGRKKGKIMKGFFIALILSLSLTLALKANAHEEIKASEVIGITTFNGDIVIARKLSEKHEILDGIKSGERIEINQEVFYPEQIAQVLTRNLTTGKIVEKKPNQPDFN